MLALKGQLRVNFVADDEQVFFHRKFGELFELRLVGHATGGIGREIENQHLATWLPRRCHTLRIDGKLIFGRRRHPNGLGMGQLNAGTVGNIAGLVVEDFVPRVEHRAQSDVQCFRHTDCDEHLFFRMIAELKILLHIAADLPAQTQQSEIIGITGVALLERKNSRLADMPRRDEVRLTDPQ